MLPKTESVIRWRKQISGLEKFMFSGILTGILFAGMAVISLVMIITHNPAQLFPLALCIALYISLHYLEVHLYTDYFFHKDKADRLKGL